jgi:hypothetical protein
MRIGSMQILFFFTLPIAADDGTHPAWSQESSTPETQLSGADPRPSAFQAGQMSSAKTTDKCGGLLPSGCGGRWLVLLLSSAARG